MEARDEAKMTMYRTTEQHCDNNLVIISLIAAFLAAYLAFKAKIAEIAESIQIADVSLTGIAADKGNRKQNLAQTGADFAGIVFAFAAATGNETLKQEVNINFSKLIKTRDDQLAPRCRNIYDRALENKDALTDYGITNENLAAFDTLINEYQAATPKPRTAVSQRKTENAKRRRLFKEADAILKEQMDKLVVNFRAEHPDFVAQYFSNRQIIDPATTTTQLRGTITNAADATPIKGALVTIVGTDKTAVTKTNGEYTIKPAPIGEFTIKVTAEGFQNFEKDEFDIMLGVANKLDAKLNV